MNQRLLSVARGETPASMVFRNARVVNVFTGEIEEADVALEGEWVAGIGPGYVGAREMDLDGAFVAPGFIDAHVHVESALVTPPEFARAVVPRGTTTAVTDPHEIANVHGLEGIRYMLDVSEGLPLTVFVQASSCVPATPMATTGAALDAEDLESLLDHPRVLGLAEVMNFPGVVLGDEELGRKLDRFRGRPVDGHAPGVRGAWLNAYVAGGPASDHESTDPGEALEKLRRGLFLFLREATNARNLRDLLPVLTSANRQRVALCTDDRQPPDLLDEGGIDAMIRTCIREGIPAVEAIRLATLNPSLFFGLRDRGAVAPGRRADLVILDDLEGLAIREVWSGGERVAAGGRMVRRGESGRPDGDARDPVRPDPVTPPSPNVQPSATPARFRIPSRPGRIRVIEAIPDQLITRHLLDAPTVRGHEVVPDPDRDLLKIAVVERHTGSGRVGLGIVKGMGLKEGAMAGTVAHDHHNVIVVGADDESMASAVEAVTRAGGGLAVTRGSEILAELPLPVGGLMSPAPIEEVRKGLDAVVEAARALGSPLHDPFMAMSFLGLEVIPSLKITDQGLVDVDAFRPVGLWEGEG